MSKRSLILWTVAGIAVTVAAAGSYALQNRRLFEPEVQAQGEDYAAARAHYRTRLTHQGPSPQRDVIALTAPDYVDVVAYSSGALRLKAWLSGDRQAQERLPAVLFLHGGFEFGAADWDMAVPYWEAGFVVMAPMLRGENGQAGTFSFLYDEVDDVLAAVEYLRKLPSVDSAHIYLAGHSAGGTLTQLAVLASGRFRAAASFDGSPDQQLLYRGSATKPGNHREVVFDPADLRELQVRSPLAYVYSLKSPIRLYYSFEAAPLAQRPSQRFVELARARGLDATAIRVWGSHMSHVARAVPQSIAFFKQSLGPESALLRRQKAPPLTPTLSGNTTFALRGHQDARVVALAGSFNGWDSQHYLCGKDGGRWICRVDLPAGKYLYQFVVDDEWINDPDNSALEDSGNGGAASVLVKR
jgi:Glycogen recognition site of AMP-activated protein kinase/Prolyl oligopeptidase family